MTPTVTAIRNGVEVDLVTDAGSWSLRLAEISPTAVSVILVDHLCGRAVLSELVDRDDDR